MDLAQRIYFADNTLSTLDLEFLGEPNFGETVKFSQRIFPPTPFPTTFILCSLILYVHAPVRTSYVHIRMCITLQDPGT